jgi:hypothetical protein
LFILDSNISFVFKGLYLKLFLEYILLINIIYLYTTYNNIILVCNLLLSFLYLIIEHYIIINKYDFIINYKKEYKCNKIICDDCICYICLEDYPDNEIYILECKHNFHSFCLEEWFEQCKNNIEDKYINNEFYNNCPLCKKIIYMSEHIRTKF